jgi:redox-sensing transcriptional repressor
MMRWNKISDAVIRRLPLYLRVLDDLAQESETESISSQELGVRAGVGPALVRKDLAWFGEFGKQGVGYEIGFLRDELRKILNLDTNLPVALVGVGSLGSALTRYHLKRFAEDASFNLELVALFDSDPAKIGDSVEGIPVYGLEDIPSQIKEKGLKIVIITVPAQNAQEVVNLFVEAGIQGILNFAPIKLRAPDQIHVVDTDVSLELQRLAYYVPKVTTN